MSSPIVMFVSLVTAAEAVERNEVSILAHKSEDEFEDVVASLFKVVVFEDDKTVLLIS